MPNLSAITAIFHIFIYENPTDLNQSRKQMEKTTNIISITVEQIPRDSNKSFSLL
jgi:hypothetical protein